jgi:pimeloyl-ACP methyl ester carboxylesterase
MPFSTTRRCPIVGDPETVNNTYVEQINASAQAAIDKAVEMGVTDPERVGVGGHSYGAFMTANLLAHSDLFRAGIARSGAYNRTLTPFGFQSERRILWEAPEVYIKVSPFMNAHKIKEPILLIHGEADNNTGTFPIQSERMYQAVRGHGGHGAPRHAPARIARLCRTRDDRACPLRNAGLVRQVREKRPAAREGRESRSEIIK